MPLQNQIKIRSIPDTNKILLSLQEVNGIKLDNKRIDNNSFWILFNGQKKVKFSIDTKSMVVELYNNSISNTYLFFSAIHVLENQGGVLLDRKHLPKWKGVKWEDKKWWNLFMRI